MEITPLCACLNDARPSIENLTVVSDVVEDSQIYSCTHCGSYWEYTRGKWDLMCTGQSESEKLTTSTPR